MNFEAFEHDAHFSRYLLLNSETKQHDLKELEFNFVELPKFTKSEHELDTVADKWIYFIKQAIKLDHIPENTDTPALKLAYDVAAQHKWSAKELEMYEAEEMEIHRRNNVLETARMEALAEGIAEGIAEGELKAKHAIAHEMLAEGLKVEMITKLTGLTRPEIETLQQGERLQ